MTGALVPRAPRYQFEVETAEVEMAEVEMAEVEMAEPVAFPSVSPALFRRH